MSGRRGPGSLGRFVALPHDILMRSDLSDGAKLTCALLLDFDRGDGAWPAKRTLARRRGKSERQVQRELRELEDAGIVDAVARSGQTTLYRLREAERGRTETAEGCVSSIAGPQTDPSGEGRQICLGGEDRSVRGGETDLSSPYKEKIQNVRSQTELTITDGRESEDDVRGLCRLLSSLVIRNGSPASCVSPDSRAWRRAAQRLLAADGRDPHEVATLIRWSQDDPFWRGVVLSMRDLRANYDRLRLQRDRPAGRVAPARSGSRAARVDREVMAMLEEADALEVAT